MLRFPHCIARQVQPIVRPMKQTIRSLLLLTLSLVATACSKATPSHALFDALAPYCGKAFGGQVISEGGVSDALRGQPVVIFLRTCTEESIELPLYLADEEARPMRLERQQDGLAFVVPGGQGDKGLVRLSTSDAKATEAVFPASEGEPYWSAEVIHTISLQAETNGLTYSINNPAAEPVVFSFDLSTPITPPADGPGAP